MRRELIIFIDVLCFIVIEWVKCVADQGDERSLVLARRVKVESLNNRE